MAVIRTVSTFTHYNMDISEEELIATLASLRYRQTCLLDKGCTAYKQETINLITVIEGRLKHG